MGIRINFSESNVTFESLNPLLEYYKEGNLSEFYDFINSSEIRNFSEPLRKIREFNKINLPKDLTDINVNFLTQKYFEIRNAITEFFGIRKEFVDYQETWIEIGVLISSIYKEEKDRLSVQEDIRKLSSADLRTAEVNFRLTTLNKLKQKVEVYNLRLEHVKREFDIAMKDLDNLRFDHSRAQSALQLALDTGEVSRVDWRSKS